MTLEQRPTTGEIGTVEESGTGIGFSAAKAAGRAYSLDPHSGPEVDHAG